MRTPVDTRGRVQAALVVGGLLFLASCVTTSRPQQFHTFFVPPAPAVAPPDESPIEPPRLGTDLYAGEVPSLTTSLPSLPSLPRPSETDLLIKTAEDRFAAGKRAFQEGRSDDAQREFNRAIE